MPVKKMFPPEPGWATHYTEAEFMELLEDRANWPELQTKVGCSEGTLRYWARKYGFSYKRGRKAEALQATADDDLLKMYNNADSLAQMAGVVGCDATALKRRLREMGLTTTGPVWRRFYSEEELRRLLALYPVGWEQVITQCNVNRRTIYRWCDRMGIQKPSEM